MFTNIFFRFDVNLPIIIIIHNRRKSYLRILFITYPFSGVARVDFIAYYIIITSPYYYNSVGIIMWCSVSASGESHITYIIKVYYIQNNIRKAPRRDKNTTSLVNRIVPNRQLHVLYYNTFRTRKIQ